MSITKKDANSKTLYDLCYELAVKAGLDDAAACDAALSAQDAVYGAISIHGGDPDLIPEEPEG